MSRPRFRDGSTRHGEGFPGQHLRSPMRSGVLWFALATCVAGSLAAQGPADPDEPPPLRPRYSEEQREDMRARIWWNDEESVSALALTESQRDRMDLALAEYFQGVEETRRATRAAQSAFVEALAEGGAGAAEKLGALGQAAGAAAVLQPQLKIAVLQVLTSSQRDLVDADYPHLLRQPWVRAGAGRARAARRAARPAEARPPGP